MLTTKENYIELAEASYYVDRAVAKMRVGFKSSYFQHQCRKAESEGGDLYVNLLMLGFLDVEEIQERWDDKCLGDIMAAAVYITIQKDHKLSQTTSTLKKFWKQPLHLQPLIVAE